MNQEIPTPRFSSSDPVAPSRIIISPLDNRSITDKYLAETT